MEGRLQDSLDDSPPKGSRVDNRLWVRLCASGAHAELTARQTIRPCGGEAETGADPRLRKTL